MEGIYRERGGECLLEGGTHKQTNSYIHTFQLVRALRGKINLVEGDRVRWAGQWQQGGSLLWEGLSNSDV